MKTSAVLLGAVASLAAAQDAGLPADIPDCGKICIGNMIALAPSLGCPGLEDACLCTNINFAYGIRDCSREACPNLDIANQVINYGVEYCANAGIDVYIPGAEIPSGTVPAVTTMYATAPPGGSQSSNPTASGGSGGAGGASSSVGGGMASQTGSMVMPTASVSGGGGQGLVPISTELIVSTETNSAGSVIETTLATSTIFSSGQAGGSAGGSASQSGSALVTGVSSSVPVVVTNSQGQASTTNVATTVPKPTSTTTPPPASAAQQAAAPIGLIVAAGIAVLLL